MAEFRKELQMSKSRTTLFLCALTFCLIGTGVYWYVDNQTTDAAVVAVIDLDEVARRIGRDVQMNKSIQQRKDLLNQQLVSIRQSFEKELQVKQNDIGKDPTDEQKQEFSQLRRNAGLRMNEANRQAEANLQQHQGALVNRFREDTKVALSPLTREKGIMLVVSRNDTVIFNYESTLDITNQVVDRMITTASMTTVETPETGDTSETAERIAARTPNNSN